MVQSIGRVAVMGSGSWGTAFAKVMADAGRDVVLWSRRAAVAEEITRQHRNGGYLPDVVLPDNLTATSDAATALTGADAVVLAVPSQTLRENLAAWRPLLPTGVTLVSTAKGVELGSLNRMSEVIADALAVPADQVAVLSGPNLAKEVGAEQPTATVIACGDVDRAEALQQACSTNYFRPYTNTDVIGCELGGACKNVIALACGMADGLGFGDNTTATLITRGLAETARLGATLGADPLTFAGLAGLGDLVATCSSPLSRNRTFGARMGRGDSLTDAQAATNGQVAEGVKSCASIRELAARNGVEMPITDSVYRVCHEGLSPRVMAAQLLGRARKAEWS